MAEATDPTLLPSPLREIAEAAWRETARIAIAALSRRPGALGEAGRTLATRATDSGSLPLPVGVAALSAHFAAGVPVAVREALVSAIDWELYTFRGGRKVETTHRLERLELDAALGAPVAPLPQAQPGFEAEVTAMDVAEPHSMGDLARYANAYLGQTFVNDAIESGRFVEVHNGSDDEAIAAMRQRGVSVVYRLATPKLHFHILLGDDLRYVIACDDGRDMFLHLQKVLRVARSASGHRIEPAHVSRVDHRTDEASYRPARFRRCFEASGAIPPQVTVGFKNALLGAITTRARSVAQVRALQKERSLPRELEAVRDFDARELLGSAAKRAWLDDRFARAVAAGEGTLLRATPEVELAIVDGADDFLDHSRLAYRDARGERREVLLVRNPYGEASVAMGTLFRDHGVEDVLVYGTAASLDRAAQVGELHFASRVTSPDGAADDFENHALHARFATLHAEPGTRVGSRIVNVRSPLDEFDCDIERLRAEGHHLVEMELAGLVRGLRGGKARIAAVHVVSDVPQSADTLEHFSPTRAERALAAAVDVWVHTFGIAELELERSRG